MPHWYLPGLIGPREGSQPLFLLLLTFVGLGLAVGSFLNLCMDRLPLGQSILRPPSHCAACQRRLALRDLIPVFSYLWLRGRCRYCGVAISPRLPAVELGMGLLFGFLAWQVGWEPKLGMVLVYVSLLSLLFVVDLEHQLILNRVVYPGMALALGFSWFWPELSPARALAGGALGLAALLLPYLLYRQGLGLGDIKLGALVGLMTGYPLVFVALLACFIGGGVVASLLLLLRVKKRRDALPFAPFLTPATLLTLLWGGTLWQWYLGWPALWWPG